MLVCDHNKNGLIDLEQASTIWSQPMFSNKVNLQPLLPSQKYAAQNIQALLLVCTAPQF